MISQVIQKSFCRYSPAHLKQIRSLSTSSGVMSKKVPEEAIPKNLLDQYYSLANEPKGHIFSNRPFRVKLEANKRYSWCSCGHSKSQPFCDGTHKIHTLKIKEKPFPLKVEETKEYWLCNCKQSEHRPFCDGTHLDPDIQEKYKHLKV